MTVTSLVAIVVAPRTGKIHKNGLGVFEREENLLNKLKKWYTKLCICVKPIVRNRVIKLEFT